MKLYFESTGRESEMYDRVLESYSKRAGIASSNIELPKEPIYTAKISRIYPSRVRGLFSEANCYVSGYFDVAYDATLRWVEESSSDLDLDYLCIGALYGGIVFPNCFVESCKKKKAGVIDQLKKLTSVEKIAFAYELKKSPLHPIMWRALETMQSTANSASLDELFYLLKSPSNKEVGIPGMLLKEKIETALSNRPKKIDLSKLMGIYLRPDKEDDVDQEF